MPSLGLLGSGCWVIGEDGQRVRFSQRGPIGVSRGRPERRHGVADDRSVQVELDVAPGADVAARAGDRDRGVAGKRTG
jgi:hypothetical protein